MSNVVGGGKRKQGDGVMDIVREVEQAPENARVAQAITDKTQAVRNSGQATGTVETGQSDGPGPLPDESRSSQGGDTGQNIAPTKKRGAYRAAVGGANSIRI